MNSKQIKMMFFLVTLVSTLVIRPSEAQQYEKCLSSINSVKGCYQVVKSEWKNSFNGLTKECCNVLLKLNDACFVLLFPGFPQFFDYNVVSTCVHRFPRFPPSKKIDV